MIKSNIPNKWLGIFPIVHPSFIAYIIAIQEVAFSVSSILYKNKALFHPSFRSVYKELHADHETGAADNK